MRPRFMRESSGERTQIAEPASLTKRKTSNDFPDLAVPTAEQRRRSGNRASSLRDVSFRALHKSIRALLR
jgi:hypothetical protein